MRRIIKFVRGESFGDGVEGAESFGIMNRVTWGLLVYTLCFQAKWRLDDDDI